MSEPQAIYGIIGNPVKHSLSPAMHNAAFKELDVEAVYKLFPLEEEELDDFFKALKEQDSPIFGLNVTIPYKEKVIPYLDSITPLAEKIQAVNTITITPDRRLIGYNTDAPGFLAHLKELKFDVQGKRIAILGAGGSARAIIATLCLLPERPEWIRIYNRTGSRIDQLLESLSDRIDTSIVESVMAVENLDIELCDLLINTTSLGMKEEDPLLVDPSLLHANMLVYDLIYNPKETLLLQMARENGARTANGLGMLFYQGTLAFQHWAQIQMDSRLKRVMRKALEAAAEKT